MNNEQPSGIPDEQPQKVFLIDRQAPPTTKSKDKIKPKYNRTKSKEHFANSWNGKAAVYDATNETKSHSYEVSFYLGKTENFLVAMCDCPARLICKHIVHAWVLHCELEFNEFVETIEDKTYE